MMVIKDWYMILIDKRDYLVILYLNQLIISIKKNY